MYNLINRETIRWSITHLMTLYTVPPFCLSNINCNIGSIVMFTLQQWAAELVQHSEATADIDSVSRFICVVVDEMA